MNSVRLRVLHRVRYSYPAPAAESHYELRLMPLSDRSQSCLDFRLNALPPARITAQDLPSGRVHSVHLSGPHSEAILTDEALVVTYRHDPFASLQLDRDDGAFYTNEGLRRRYAEYLQPTEQVPFSPEADRIASVARRQAGIGTASFLIALTRLLHRVFTYPPDAAAIHPALQNVLASPQDAIRDFAHLMLAVCRRQGIPARYLSGYFYVEESAAGHPEPDAVNAALAVQRGNGRAAMHSWVECLLPNERWHGFDPALNQLANDAYIKVHYGRDYSDVAPLRGLYRGPLAPVVHTSIRITTEN